jgi:hypothetical protein
VKKDKKPWQRCVLSGNLYTGLKSPESRIMNKYAIALALCLSVNFVYAAKKVQPPQNPFTPGSAQLPDVPLTADSIRKVIASFDRLRAEFKDFQPSVDAQDMEHYMRGSDAALKKGETIVREAGFSGWADWSAHFAKTMQTYMAYKMRDTGRVNQAQLDQQIQAIQNNSSLTAEQKKMALDMMGMAGTYTQMTSNVPEADLKTLEPFIGQLEQVMTAVK